LNALKTEEFSYRKYKKTHTERAMQHPESFKGGIKKKRGTNILQLAEE
jgi:hypothetical protein